MRLVAQVRHLSKREYQLHKRLSHARCKQESTDITSVPHNFLGSGGWIRTNDLWVMSPTSFHCSTPQLRSISGDRGGVKDLIEFLAGLTLVEASDKELGYLLGNLFLVSLPEVVGPGYNLAVLGFRDFLNILLEL